jgi:hypothetical protein
MRMIFLWGKAKNLRRRYGVFLLKRYVLIFYQTKKDLPFTVDPFFFRGR